MVSGQVEAPRVDLANEDLLRAHVHAVWLATSGLSLGKSMSEILDLADDQTQPKLKPQVWDALADKHALARTRQRAKRVLAGLEPDLEGRVWWYDEWLDDVLSAIPARFQQALERWITLYMSAMYQVRRQSKVIRSAGRSPRDRNTDKKLRREAERQLGGPPSRVRLSGTIRFLHVPVLRVGGVPCRAIRFPVSPCRRSSRVRLAGATGATTCNGPGSWQSASSAPKRTSITRVPAIRSTGCSCQAAPTPPKEEAAGLTVQAKRCDHCGYMHPVDEQTGQDVCRYCERPLGRPLYGMLQMRNVSTRYRERITSDEERRRRVGYELISGIEFAERQGQRSVTKATIAANEVPLLELSYGDTATIWRVNLGWRRRQHQNDHGFLLNTEKGEWATRNNNDSIPAAVWGVGHHPESDSFREGLSELSAGGTRQGSVSGRNGICRGGIESGYPGGVPTRTQRAGR